MGCYRAGKNGALVPGTELNGIVPTFLCTISLWANITVRRFYSRKIKTFKNLELLIEQLLGKVGYRALNGQAFLISLLQIRVILVRIQRSDDPDPDPAIFVIDL